MRGRNVDLEETPRFHSFFDESLGNIRSDAHPFSLCKLTAGIKKLEVNKVGKNCRSIYSIATTRASIQPTYRQSI